MRTSRSTDMPVYETALGQGITRTPEFQRKGLASFAANVGTKCGHGCLYCSTGSMLRMHSSFAEVSRNPFDDGYAIVDPNSVERIAYDAAHKTKRGMVQLCTTVDAWSPEAQRYGLGRNCLEAILRQPGWIVRILTKNAAVSADFDVIERYRDRVLLGLSITATPDRGDVTAILEPYASTIDDRMAAMKEAHRRGLRTYGMLCPLLPGIADSPQQIDELVRSLVNCGVEEIFAEGVNPRGNGLIKTQEALEAEGYHDEAEAIREIRNRQGHSRYVVRLLDNVQQSVRKHTNVQQLRFLLYPSSLTPNDAARIQNDGAGVIWLA